MTLKDFVLFQRDEENIGTSVIMSDGLDAQGNETVFYKYTYMGMGNLRKELCSPEVMAEQIALKQAEIKAIQEDIKTVELL